MGIIKKATSILVEIFLTTIIVISILGILYMPSIREMYSIGNPHLGYENCAKYEIYFFQQAMKRKFGLKRGDGAFTSEGTTVEPSKITKMLFVFHKQGNYTIENARKLFLDVANEFCNRVNEDENIWKFFDSQHCTLNDIELTLHFIPKVKSPLENCIEIVTNQTGNIAYKYYDQNLIGFKSKYEESYNEAIYSYLKEINGK